MKARTSKIQYTNWKPDLQIQEIYEEYIADPGQISNRNETKCSVGQHIQFIKSL